MASVPITCPECDAYRNAHGNTGLRAAAASVGMSHGLSAQEAIDVLFAQYHANGHRFTRGSDG